MLTSFEITAWVSLALRTRWPIAILLLVIPFKTRVARHGSREALIAHKVAAAVAWMWY